MISIILKYLSTIGKISIMDLYTRPSSTGTKLNPSEKSKINSSALSYYSALYKAQRLERT